MSENDYTKYINKMTFSHSFTCFVFFLVLCLIISECHADANDSQNTTKLVIDASFRRPIPHTFFGAMFEVKCSFNMKITYNVLY